MHGVVRKLQPAEQRVLVQVSNMQYKNQESQSLHNKQHVTKE